MSSIGGTSSLGQVNTNDTNSATGALTAAGVGSGLDVNGLVTSLVDSKITPQANQIKRQTTSAQTQLTAIGTVSSALSQLKTAATALSDGSAFGARSTHVSDSSVFSASAGADTVPGSYDLNVTQLAAAQKASSGAFADATTAVGTGTLTVSVGSKSLNLSLDSSNNSLSDIRDAINNAKDNPGVAATIVTGSDGAHLVLSSRSTGANNAFSVSSTGGDGGLSALGYDAASNSGSLNVVTAAQDAKFSIDGLAASSASNTVTGSIDGVTLNLQTTGTSTLQVSRDQGSATTAVNTFVSAYNNFVSLYKQLTAYDPTSGNSGALNGDATLSSIDNTLSSIVSSASSGSGSSYASLGDIGIDLQVDGTLKVDNGKLQTALSTKPEQVQSLFGGDNGYAGRIGSHFDSWLGNKGILGVRTSNLNQRISDLGDQQAALDQRQSDLEARYRAQFTALDATLSKLNNTSSYLKQQFNALNNTGSSSSSGG